MFGFFEGPKKPEQPKAPAFEELTAALPEELRDEFQKLGEEVQNINVKESDGGEIKEELLSDEDKKTLARYDELTKMAEANLGNK
jgi:hypothetical protein